jgi:hypothetical protein
MAADDVFLPPTLAQLLTVLLRDGRERFVAEHDTPFLVGPPPKDAGDDWSFRTGSLRTVRAGSGSTLTLLEEGYLAIAVKKRRTGAFMDTVLLGRAKTNDIMLPSESISKLHARMKLGDGHSITLFDAGSSNGTFVGDEQLEPDKGRAVAPGEILTFGDLSFHIFEPQGLLDILVRLKDA